MGQFGFQFVRNNISYERCHFITPLCSEDYICTRYKASAESDQGLPCPHEETMGPKLPIECIAKTLFRLGGCPG